MMDQGNGNNTSNNEQQPMDAAKLKIISSRNMSTVCLIMAPVSLFLGGVFLSAVALIFGIVALVKVSSAMHGPAADDPYAKIMRIRALIGIGISIVAGILNAYALMAALPAIMDMLNGESLEDVMSALEEGTANSAGNASDDMASGGAGSRSVFG